MKEKYCLKLIFNEEIGCQEIFIAEKMTDKLIDKKEAVKLLNDHETRIQNLEQEQIAKRRELNDVCWKLERELAELKQKAIVPEYWQKLKDLQSRTDRPFKNNRYTIFELETKFKKELKGAKND
jgi:argininosuccinate lyase